MPSSQVIDRAAQQFEQLVPLQQIADIAAANNRMTREQRLAATATFVRREDSGSRSKLHRQLYRDCVLDAIMESPLKADRRRASRLKARKERRKKRQPSRTTFGRSHSRMPRFARPQQLTELSAAA